MESTNISTTIEIPIKTKKKKEKKDVYMTSFYVYKDKNTKELFHYIWKIGSIANKLYNQMLFYCRMYNSYFGIYPSFNNICAMLLNSKIHGNKEYNIYNQLQNIITSIPLHYTIQMFHGVISGHKEALDDFYKNPKKYTAKPHFPYFSEEEIREFASGYNPLLYDENKQQYYIELKNRSKKDQKKSVLLYIPDNTIKQANLSNAKKLQQIRFIPIISNTVKIEITYIPEKQLFTQLNADLVLGIDLGDKNFATCITNDSTLIPFILDGKNIISWNNRVNLIKSQIQPKMQLYNGSTIPSNQLKDWDLWKKKKINDLFHKYAQYLVRYCFEHDIGTVIMGYNEGWKQNAKQNKGKNGNRKFGRNSTRQHEQIPHYKFKQIIEYVFNHYHIQLKTVEEEYSSSTDHLGYESIEFHPSNKVEGIKRNLSHPHPYKEGQHVRGLFKSPSLKVTINSDINGAIGHIRRVIGDDCIQSFREMVTNKIIFRPHRISYLELN